MKSLALTLMAALTLATAACVPVEGPATRLSPPPEAACRFTPDTCADLPKVSASVW